LLTGLHCQRIGHNGTHWNQPTDFTKCVSVGELLQGAGYRTVLIGKWQERDLPSKRGFDRFFGPMCQAKISYFHEVRGRHDFDQGLGAADVQAIVVIDAANRRVLAAVHEARLVGHLRQRGEPAPSPKNA
jgi:arylsulfatase A-like enzyme